MKPKKNSRRITNIRAEKAKQKILGNKGNMGKSLREAGYSKTYANNPQLFKKTKAGQEFTKQCEDEIKELWLQAKATRGKAKHRECIQSIDTLQKCAKLEKGEPTEITAVEKMENFARDFFK